MNARERDPFEILGVPPDAEHVIIRSAYRSRAKMHHPDNRYSGSTGRMAELNWAWEELQRDREGWSARVMSARRSALDLTVRGRKGDDEAAWKKFTDQYRRSPNEPLRWRAWFGSDVVCAECGCALNTYVYKCPDCGAIDKWQRSSLHTIGHKLRFVYYAVLSLVVIPVGLFFLLLLAVPVILVLDMVGVMKDDRGWPWEWGIDAQILVAVGILLEIAVILRWNQIVLAVKKVIAAS